MGDGRLSLEGAIGKLERLEERFPSDAESSFDRWLDDYMWVGNDETTHWMLNRALARLREIAE